MVVTSLNPNTGKTIAEFSYDSLEQSLAKSQKSYQCFLSEYSIDIEEHIILSQKRLKKLGDSLESAAKELALLITQEMGKSLLESKAEVRKSIQCIRWYEKELSSLRELKLYDKKEGYLSLGTPKAVGPVLAIMPWNYPLWQVIRVLAPAWGIGNPVLLKPSEDVWCLSQKFIELAQSVWGEGIQFIKAPVPNIEVLLADKSVAAVTLTGSVSAGRSVASLAGKFGKKSVLELGGSDPALLLDSCELEKDIKTLIKARLLNGGQSCISPKRWFVPKEKRKECLEFLKTELSAFAPPVLVNEKAIVNLNNICSDAEKCGDTCFYKSDERQFIGEERGPNLYPIKAYEIKNNESPFLKKEVFGPIIAVYFYEHLEEAIKLANDSEFGLGASVFGKDLSKAKEVVNQIHAGMVSINECPRSKINEPFGGVKSSGYGVELGEAGFFEFVNMQVLKVPES